MTYPVSLATLQTRVLQRANLEGAAQFISPTELTDHINQSIAEWYDLVRLTTWGGQYYRVQGAALPGTTNGQTIAGQATYALPSNFLSMLSVDWFVSGQALVVNVRPFQEEDRNIFRFWPVGWLFDQPVFYQLWGNNITFIPSPQSSFTLTLNYVPVAPKLGNPQDSLDSINGWDEWIVLDSAIKCLTKDGQLDIIPMLEQMKQQQAMRIQSAAASRDQANAEIVHDLTDGYAGDYWR